MVAVMERPKAEMMAVRMVASMEMSMVVKTASCLVGKLAALKVGSLVVDLEIGMVDWKAVQMVSM